MRTSTAVLASVVVLSGCTNPPPTIDCQLATDCETVAAAARQVLPAGEATWVIVAGRGAPGVLHAEVHACYPDGRYLVVDVFDGTGVQASLRNQTGSDPPCR